MQLWRDKELTILNTEDKQLTQVKNVISWILKEWLQQVLKNPRSSSELKQKLLSWRKLL
jgi:hypothetical protein